MINKYADRQNQFCAVGETIFNLIQQKSPTSISGEMNARFAPPLVGVQNLATLKLKPSTYKDVLVPTLPQDVAVFSRPTDASDFFREFIEQARKKLGALFSTTKAKRWSKDAKAYSMQRNI